MSICKFSSAILAFTLKVHHSANIFFCEEEEEKEEKGKEKEEEKEKETLMNNRKETNLFNSNVNT